MITKIDNRFNETVHIIKLKNGMQVHLLPKEDPYFSTYVECSIPFGSNDLVYKQNDKTTTYPPGSAHFMEHKIFAMEDGDAFLKFSKLGVDANAMTSYAQTSYLFTATNHLLPALKLLLKMLDRTYFTDENIQAEEKIIAEELKMYQDDIEQEIYQDLMRQMFFKHPFKHDIGGSLQSIKKIDKDVLQDIYQKFYHPSNRLLVIAGKFEIEEIKNYFASYDKTLSHDKVDIITPDEPLDVKNDLCVKEKDISIDKIAIGFKIPLAHAYGSEHVKEELTYTILFNLLIGTTSNVYYDLLDQHLINRNFYTQSTFGKQFGHFMIFGDSKSPKILKDKLLESFHSDIDDLFNEIDFKRYLKTYVGHLIFALNQVEHKAYLYTRYYHKGVYLYDLIDLIQSITYEDLQRCHQKFINFSHSTVIYKKG